MHASQEIGTGLRNSEYNPNSFPGVLVRMKRPVATTARIHASGKVTLTRPKSVEDATRALKKFEVCEDDQGSGIFTQALPCWKVSGSFATGFSIHLARLQDAHSIHSSYEPEISPFLIYKMKLSASSVVTLNIFENGFVTLKAKSKDGFDRACLAIQPILLQFKKAEEGSSDLPAHSNFQHPSHEVQAVQTEGVQEEIESLAPSSPAAILPPPSP